MGSLTPSRFTGDPSHWTGDSTALGMSRTALRIKAAQLTQLIAHHGCRAVACHDFVRTLRLDPDSHTCRPAPEVLVSRAASTFEKSNLLVALLRLSDIPARLRIFSVDARLLLGHAEHTAVAYHPMVEAWIDGRWIVTDTFHLDLEQALASRRKLIGDGGRVGHGVHLDGALAWDGSHDAYALFCAGDPSSLPLRDWGAFNDCAGFAREVERLAGWMRPSGFGFLRSWSH